MPSPSDLVTQSFAQALAFEDNALSQLATFTSRLNAAVQTAPLINISFQPIAMPGSATPPTEVPEWVDPAEYTSPLMDAISAKLTERMNAAGGTGLPVDVEAGIWDRARERESATMHAAIDAALYDSEALGFSLPPGVLADGVRRATRAYYDSAAALSRDIAIKQAELVIQEQMNLQRIYESAVALARAMVDVRLQNTQVAVSVFNAKVEGFRAQLLQFTAEVDQEVKQWEAASRQNEAIATYTMNGQKINADIIHANLATILEAGKMGAQVYAQLASAAHSNIHANASVSASAGMSVTYGYTNQTSGTAPTVTAI